MTKDWDAETAAALEGDDEPVHYGDRTDMPIPPAAPIPKRVMVLGSAGWNQRLIVEAVLLTWAHEHGGPAVYLTTGQGQGGAEGFARDFAVARREYGWAAVALPDMDLFSQADQMDAVFAFVKDGSEVSSLVSAIATKRAVRVFRDDVEEPTGAWARR